MKTFDFPKSSRLLKPKDYSGVFNHVQTRVSHRHFLILATRNDLGHARVGLVFSKKTLRLSVQRNRIKRLVRESFRHQTDLPDLDIVVLSRRGLSDLSNTQVTAILDDLWDRLKQKSQLKQPD
ncbi:MAG: ribonuclease P protein component [Oleiphilaceae bacterium]|nr:ribonuclease P protein component [Oleiphilaceae bacterium]